MSKKIIKVFNIILSLTSVILFLLEGTALDIHHEKKPTTLPQNLNIIDIFRCDKT